MSHTVLEWDRVKACRAVVPRHVVFRVLVSETVLLNIDTGLYHGMDETGSRFFEVLSDSTDLESAVDVLLKEFAVPRERIRADLLDYCSDLLDRGLIELEGPER